MKRNMLGIAGVALGAAALLTAVLHFWLGPIDPPPPLEQVVADQLVRIRDAVVAGVTGAPAAPVARSGRGPDELLRAATGAAAAIAIILGTLSFIRREERRIAGAAAMLGAGTIAFHFLTLAIGMLLFLVLLSAALSLVGAAPG